MRSATAWCMAGSDLPNRSIIDDEVLKGIEQCIELAPAPQSRTTSREFLAARKLFGAGTPQVAVFDTAFHHSLPEQAYLYAIPYDLYRRHRIRRYGFHGTSHRYRRISLPRCCGKVTREQDPRHHAASRERLFGGGDPGWISSGHLDGHDAARGVGDGNPIGRSRSCDRQSDFRKGRAVGS